MLKHLFTRDFFKDRLALSLGLFGLFLGIGNVLNVVLRVQARDFDVPIRYSQYGGSPIELGNWYELYSLALFAIVVTVINLILALRLFPVQRNLSITVFTLNIFVMILLFFVGNSLINVAPTG